MNSGTDSLIQHLTHTRGQRLVAVGAGHITDTRMLDYIEGTLDTADEQRVRAHLGECPDCKKAVLLLRAHGAKQQDVAVEPGVKRPATTRPAWLQTLDWLRGHGAYAGWATTGAIALVTAAILFTPVDQPPQLAGSSKNTGAAPQAAAIPQPVPAGVRDLTIPEVTRPSVPASIPETTAPITLVSREPVSPAVTTPFPPLNAAHLFAVVIANADYSAVRLPPAPFALNDADGVLRWLGAFGVPSDRTLFLENASSARLNEIFGSRDHAAGILSQSIDADTDVLVYYSGHAVPDLNTHRPYLLPVDADPNYAALSGYALETLLNNVSQLNARSVTVVLETSFAGTAENAALFRGISPGLVDVIIPESVSNKVTVFASAGRGQVNNANPTTRRHFFTESLLRALNGAADSNRDHIVNTDEVAQFIRREVADQARRAGSVQTPWTLGITKP